jgi:nucleolin
MTLRALAAVPSAALPKSKCAPFLVLLSPTPPCHLFHPRSARRLPLAPLAASDTFESSAAVDFAEPDQASEDEGGAFESDEEEASGRIEELEEEVTAAEGGAEEEVGEYVEPPEEAKVYVGNLPYDVDGEGLAQLFEQAGIVEVAEVSVHSFSYPSASYGN